MQGASLPGHRVKTYSAGVLKVETIIDNQK